MSTMTLCASTRERTRRWAVGSSKRPCAACGAPCSRGRALGPQVSKKKYIYTIDDDCFVAKDPSGADINALEQHIRNLLTPSTPLFFNTLYDPYAAGADFVRGYPFSLREGCPTAISHGALHFVARCEQLALPAADSSVESHCSCVRELQRAPRVRAAGLWLNIPDYDAPTQMVKPLERNTRYVDAVLTIPKVCWYRAECAFNHITAVQALQQRVGSC